MKKLLLPLVALAAFAVVSTSCKKEEATPEETPAAPSSGTPTVNIVDADGALTAVKTASKISYPGIPDQEIIIGTAVGVFLKDKNTSQFVAAGTVKCESNTLTKQSNNAYVYTPGTTNPTGIDFGSGASWEVSGSTDVPAFSGSFTRFPSVPDWTKTNITTSSAITINLNDYVDYADSIIVTLACGSTSVTKTFAGNMASFSFSADEAKKLAKGNGLVQFAPWSYKLAPVEGKKFYYVNESVLSVYTTFQ